MYYCEKLIVMYWTFQLQGLSTVNLIIIPCICHMSKFQLDILKGPQDMVNLGSLPLINPKAEMSNTLKLTFRSNASISVSD